MQVLVNFVSIINRQTIVVVFLSLVATYLCIQFEIYIDLPTGLVGIAIVFPIVFSINAAYRRREEALRYFASFKGYAMSLFFAHRDWLPEADPQHARRFKQLLNQLLKAIQGYFVQKDERQFQEIYRLFSQLSLSMETLRDAGVSGSEVSRSNQSLRSMMIEFERMHNIHLYRTPTALRAYSQVFLNIFPIFFAPAFANLSHESFLASGFLVAAFYSLILVSLDNIQEDLENPYDAVGADDLNLSVAQLYNPILRNSDGSPIEIDGVT